MMFSLGTQCAYTAASAWMAAWPLGVSRPPIKTRSGFSKSSIAVPSARNSGFERICQDMTRYDSTIIQQGCKHYYRATWRCKQVSVGTTAPCPRSNEACTMKPSLGLPFLPLLCIWSRTWRLLTWNSIPCPFFVRIFSIASAVFTGTVDFSTT
jgi:hypothetical protein